MPQTAKAHKSHKPRVRPKPETPDWYTLGDLSYPSQEDAQKVADAVVKTMGQGEASTEGSEDEPTAWCL